MEHKWKKYCLKNNNFKKYKFTCAASKSAFKEATISFDPNDSSSIEFN